MAVFADFLVGLAVQVRGGDQDAELAVAQPGDEPAGFPDTYAVIGCVALGFEGELDRDRVGVGAQEVVADGITSAVAPRAGDVDPVHLGIAAAHQVGGELLEVMRPLLEVLVDQGQQRLVRGQRVLGLPGADDDRGGASSGV